MSVRANAAVARSSAWPGPRLLWPFFHQFLNAEPDVMKCQVVQTGAAEIVVKTICRAADKSGLARLKMAAARVDVA